MAKAAAAYPKSIVAVGVDTWGVDYGLLDSAGNLVDRPFQYRDPRTNGMIEEACKRVSLEELYQITGIQIIFFNTLIQLLAEAKRNAPALARADRLLFMPDIINYWLSGRKVSDRTIAGTSQMLDLRTGGWARDLVERLGIPSRILGEIVEPGTVLGPVLANVGREIGVPRLKVIATAGHDTNGAVACIPMTSSSPVFISSGTWSIMGTECPQPVVTARSLAESFSNESAVAGTFNFLKNICGLWLVQECKRTWAQEGADLDYGTLTRLSEEARSFVAVVDPDDGSFVKPDSMPQAIQDFCRRTGQEVPRTRGEILRTATESLALKYRRVLERLEQLTGQTAQAVHIVGGGAQNRQLNQFAANAIHRPVIVGPIEATSIGNILVQMMATGEVVSMADGREMVRRSFATETYTPQAGPEWDQAYQKLLNILS
jgi:sugar (pentulose or hexulose) kinase